jgi:heterodisulfide reductase subunit A-like polyferredoxin
VEVPNEYDFGIGKRKAIFVPYPQAVPLVACVDPRLASAVPAALKLVLPRL